MSSIPRLFWLAVVTAHIVVAAGWWWFMPGGFPVTHPRFWVNRVFPIVVILAAGAARWASFSRKETKTQSGALLAMFPAAWLAGAIAARVAFPVTFQILWVGPLIVAGTMLAALWPMRYAIARQRLLSGMAILVASAIAVFGVFAQRGADPSTRPLNLAMPAPSTQPWLPSDMRSIRLSGAISVEPAMAVVNVQAGRMFIGAQPLLTFVSRSPDRCWTLFARRMDRNGPRRTLVDVQNGVGANESAVELTYRDDARHTLRITGTNDDVKIESNDELPAAVYSHLNTYCELTIAGHRKLELAFSPCPSRRIEVTYSEYPRGKPRRCAFLSADGAFRVVEASSGEKGPFRTLAEGRLEQSRALTMTLYDDSIAVAEIEFDDFAAQADTSPSPTAGWGLPCNAIEFSLQDESPRSAAGIFISLAGTSVGRGYDTVGHAPGTYRNRMRVRRISLSGPATRRAGE